MRINLHARPMLASHGTAIAVIAACALIGHLLGVNLFSKWDGAVPMAIPTAICFLLTGSCFVALAIEPTLWKAEKSWPAPPTPLNPS